MKKWLIDFEIADDPLYCEVYYDKELDRKRYIYLYTGEEFFSREELFDTEAECLDAKINEMELFWNVIGNKNFPSEINLLVQKRYDKCVGNKKRITIHKFFQEL